MSSSSSGSTGSGEKDNHISQQGDVVELTSSAGTNDVCSRTVITKVFFCSPESFLSLTGSRAMGLYFFKSMGNFSKSQSCTFWGTVNNVRLPASLRDAHIGRHLG